VGVDHREIERGEVKVAVCDGKEHGAINNWVSGVDISGGLERETRVVAGQCQVGVSEVELRHPSDVCWWVHSGAVGHVAVVGADGETLVVPLEEDLLPGERQRLRLVVRNSRAATVSSNIDVEAACVGRNGGDRWVSGTAARNLVFAGIVGRETIDVGIVYDVECREVLPRETRGVGRAR